MAIAPEKNLLVRPALDHDQEFAFQVKKAALGRYVDMVWGWDETFQRTFHQQDWAQHRPDIVMHDSEAIGTLEVISQPDHIYVGEFYLNPDWQRRGIGTQLLRDVLARADNANVETRLQFLKVNPVRSLYERHGFEIVGETTTHYIATRVCAPLATRSSIISGLQYVPDYLDVATHDRLLAAVDQNRWLQSVDHGVQTYGYRYSRAADALLPADPLPPWANELAEQLCRDGLMPGVPDQLVANEYPVGTGIFSHMDQSVFGNTVASLSLGSTCVMQFVHNETGRLKELLLEPRSALVLNGDARWQWKHGIPARAVDRWQSCDIPRSRRVSLTYRIVSPETERR